ncbi:MAG: hypothetical protein Q9171_003925 [Xanthocarpia ochracea]
MLSFGHYLKPVSAQRLLLLKQPKGSLPCLRRTLSTSIRQHAAKNTKLATKPPRPNQIASKPIKGPASGNYKSFNQTLADRSEPLLLYQAASHTIYMAGCYSVGLLIFGWIAHTTSLIHTWTPVKYGPYLKVGYYSMLAMAGAVATMYIIRPFRIIKTIQAVPIALKPNQKSLHLQIESTRMFPFIKPKTVSIPVNDATLSRPLFLERSHGESSNALEARRRLEAEKLRKLWQGNFFLLPFRQLGFHLSKGFRGLKDAFMKNPFIYLRAKGFNNSWKLDKETGWALDDGRAIDRIIKTRMTS